MLDAYSVSYPIRVAKDPNYRGKAHVTVGDEIILAIERDPRFGELGVSAQELRDRFQALGIESRE